MGAGFMTKADFRVMVLSDLHIPFHDRRALELFKTVAKATKASHCVCIGDFVDLYSLNRFGLSAQREADLEKELARGRKELKAVREIFDVFKFLEGNHERRYTRYVDESAIKLGKVIPTIREQLGVHAHEWVEYQKYCKFGKMHFVHDLGYSGQNALRQSLAAFGGSITIGHTHRGSVEYSGNVRGERHVGLNVGWLGDSRYIDYSNEARMRGWQLGWGVVDVAKDQTVFAQFVPVVKNRCCIDGVVYG